MLEQAGMEIPCFFYCTPGHAGLNVAPGEVGGTIIEAKGNTSVSTGGDTSIRTVNGNEV